MTPEQILSHEPARLTQRQREFYFANGYLLLERMITIDTIERLRGVTAAKIEETRNLTKSNAIWDLEAGHSATTPKLRRLSSACDQHRPTGITRLIHFSWTSSLTSLAPMSSFTIRN